MRGGKEVCNGSPLRRFAAISWLFGRAILSLRLRFSVSVLALSVTFGDSSPRGRAIGRPGHFLLDARGRYDAKARALLQRAGPSSYNLSVSADALPPPLARGGGTASAVTERLYEGRGFGRPEGAKDPLSEMAAPRGAGYLAKFQNIIDSSSQIELCHVGKLKACWQSR